MFKLKDFWYVMIRFVGFGEDERSSVFQSEYLNFGVIEILWTDSTDN